MSPNQPEPGAKTTNPTPIEPDQRKISRQDAPGRAATDSGCPTTGPIAHGVSTPESATEYPTPALTPDPANRKKQGGRMVPHAEVVRETAKALYLQGLSTAQVSKASGVPMDTLRKWVKRLGWTSVRATLQARAHEAAMVVVQSSLSSVSKSLRADLAKELQDQANALKARPVKSVLDMRGTKYREGRTKVVKTLVEASSIVCGWETETKVGLIVPMCGMAEPSPAIDVEAEELEPAPAAAAPIISGAIPDALEPAP